MSAHDWHELVSGALGILLGCVLVLLWSLVVWPLLVRWWDSRAPIDVAPGDPRWVKALDLRDLLVYHLDGREPHEHPQPRRWHRCTPALYAWEGFRLVERCACGAIRLGGPTHGWLDRNSRTR